MTCLQRSQVPNLRKKPRTCFWLDILWTYVRYRTLQGCRQNTVLALAERPGCH